MVYNKVLITGGAGFIGSHLALKLDLLGYDVTIMDNLSPQVHGANPRESSPLYKTVASKIRFFKGDVTSRQDWEIVLQNQDVVIHLAAETGTGQSMYEIHKYAQTNVGGTALMLEVLMKGTYPLKKIILGSSRAVYGEGKYRLGSQTMYPQNRLEADLSVGHFDLYDPRKQKLSPCATDENSAIHPVSIYGITKFNQEQLIRNAGSHLNVSTVVFRYQNVFGAGQSLSNPYTGILSIFSTQILSGHQLNIFEDGKESRDFVYIDDVVDATILGLEHEEANDQIFNVGTGKATTILEAAQALINAYDSQITFKVSGQYRVGDIRHNFADISKIKKILNYEPKVTFLEGIDRFSRWVKTQNCLEDHLSSSLNELKEKGLLK